MMQYRKLKDLHPLEGNPRTLDDKGFKELCASIEANADYFEARPIILSDRTGKLVIIGGNQRYHVAKHLGLKEVPTHLIPDLTEEREREIIIRDNVNNGKWDWDTLANEWNSLELEEWGLDVPGVDEKAEADNSNENFDLTVICTSDENKKETAAKLYELGFELKD